MIFPLVAVDIGNSRLKFGLYLQAGPEAVPLPARAVDLLPGIDPLDAIAGWLSPLEIDQVAWRIASVNRSHTTWLLDWLRSRHESLSIMLLASGDLPLVVRVPQPDRVGIDRLVGAVAANRLREADRSAIVVDLGTAITVDFVAPDGAFMGGAILPGISMSARALYEFTDLLPQIDMASLAEPPPALGTATEESMRTGLYWGAVGGVRELIARLAAGQPQRPQVFLTGGAAPAVAALLSHDALYVPHLLLGGIVLTAS